VIFLDANILIYADLSSLNRRRRFRRSCAEWPKHLATLIRPFGATQQRPLFFALYFQRGAVPMPVQARAGFTLWVGPPPYISLSAILNAHISVDCRPLAMAALDQPASSFKTQACIGYDTFRCAVS
jgi:hypothetical protein